MFPVNQQGKVLATDLDGTLFYPKAPFRVLNVRTHRFLKRFLKDGGTLLLVTSRNEEIRKSISKKLGADIDMVGCNGAFVISHGQRIKETPFPAGEGKKVVEDLKENYPKAKTIVLSSKAENMVLPWSRYAWLLLLYRIGMLRIRERTHCSSKAFARELESGEIYKIQSMVGFSEKSIAYARRIVDEMTPKYPDLLFTWAKQAVEIAPPGCSKAEGIAFYLDYNKISPSDVYVVGDGENDIPMFDAFPAHSYCMAQGAERAKAHASRTIKRFDELEGILYPSEDEGPQSNPKRKKKELS